MGSRSRIENGRVRAMKTEWNEVLQAALALPAESRHRLLDELATSLEADGPPVTEEMKRELQRRDDAMTAGASIDSDTFLKHVRRRR